MALIVETGAIVPGANSWVSRAEYIAYALSLGVVVEDTDASDVELVKAAQFIGSHESNLKGYLVDRDQPLAFPRYDVTIDNWSWTHTEIPRNVILCQLAIALDINSGIDPYNPPVNPSRAVKRQRVEGAVEVEYMEGKDQKLGRTSTADALLRSLLRRSGLHIVAERS